MDYKEEKYKKEEIRELKLTNRLLERITDALEDKKVSNKCIEKSDIGNTNSNVRIYEYRKVKDVYLLTYFEEHIGHEQSFTVAEEEFKDNYEVLD